MIPKQNIAFLDVSVVDGCGNWPQNSMAVIVKNGIISEITPMRLYQKQTDVPELLLGGHYLMPGLIDAHVHLAGGRTSAADAELGVMLEHEFVRAMRSVSHAQSLLKWGFTSVRDISVNGLYLKRVIGEGSIIGPRIIACGPGLGRTGGHTDLYQLPEQFVAKNHFWGILADGPEEIRKSVRRLLREGADQIKIWASGGGNWPNDRNCDVQYSFEELSMCVEEAHRQKGTLVCCHAENNESIRLAIKAGVDTIEHGEDLDEETAEQMAKQGILLIPTLKLLLDWYQDFMPSPEQLQAQIRPEVFLHRDESGRSSTEAEQKEQRAILESFRLAREKGVKIALGSDTVYEPVTAYGAYSALEYLTMIECGMEIPEAIKAATGTAAEALGLAHRIGTITVGKEADFLILKKDPTAEASVLCDPDNIEMIFCGGIPVIQHNRLCY